jgi:hypothetical protein
VDQRAQLQEEKESGFGWPRRTRSNSFCAARRGPGRPVAALRACKAGYSSPFSPAEKRPTQHHLRKSRDHSAPRPGRSTPGLWANRDPASRKGWGLEAPAPPVRSAGKSGYCVLAVERRGWGEMLASTLRCNAASSIVYVTVSDFCCLSLWLLNRTAAQELRHRERKTRSGRVGRIPGTAQAAVASEMAEMISTASRDGLVWVEQTAIGESTVGGSPVLPDISRLESTKSSHFCAGRRRTEIS